MQTILNQNKAIYLQIKEKIEQDILRGILQEGEKIPSTDKFAKLYVINRSTAAKGIKCLVDEGTLIKKRGIGMFVVVGAKKKIMERHMEHFFDDYIRSLLIEATCLGFSDEELIEMISF